MDETKPWEEMPDENYWVGLLGANVTVAPTEGNCAAGHFAGVGARGSELRARRNARNCTSSVTIAADCWLIWVTCGGSCPASQLSAFPAPGLGRGAHASHSRATSARRRCGQGDRNSSAARNRLILSERRRKSATVAHRTNPCGD